MTIKRYNLRADINREYFYRGAVIEFSEDADGPWVTHADHLAAVALAQKEATASVSLVTSDGEKLPMERQPDGSWISQPAGKDTFIVNVEVKL